jgi:tetratricopeptide (TPR) repeat protein
MNRVTRFAPAVLPIAMMGCSGPQPNVPLYGELGSYHRIVSGCSEDAQRYFDQGLMLYYGFNHDEAIRAFRQAAEFDPQCAMASWGMAVSAGPNINKMEMDEAASSAAHEAAQRALALVEWASPADRALIRAVARRYAWPPPEDRRALDEAYAEAMREAWRQHPDDPDVGALCAESVMDLRPWDLWSADGEPRPETSEVIATLEAVLALERDHPGANHFYVHTMEASPHPERALEVADRLGALVPGAGHLVHMPSHIYVRVGRYDDIVRSNQAAIAADLRYLEASGTGRGGFYSMYRAHNYHFLAYGAMFDGRRELAMQAARDMGRELPLETVRAFPDFLDGFIATPVHVMVRFGLWQELLDEPQPPDELKVTVAFWHYGRTVALSALGRVEEAAVEFAALQRAFAAVPESRLIGNNPARTVLEVALPMAEGELEYRRGNHARAFELLREAVRRDDALRYDEPWGWMQPVRHALGALLLEQGRTADAEAVYREDLRLHPGNGWALHGLAECQRRGEHAAEAADTEARFRAAWARSDIVIMASCYCRTRA